MTEVPLQEKPYKLEIDPKVQDYLKYSLIQNAN